VLERFDVASARRDIARARLHAVCRHAALYPKPLSGLDDPPAVLHSTAPPERLFELCSGPMVAVVGARCASAYGLEVATELGRTLSRAGVTVVSGLALGIDAAAHRGALDGGGRTIAVLGCGADVRYPRTNRGLYERIREAGAVLAELPPGQEAAKWTFPARNRIMAGLAGVTVVVEAAERSGSLITAHFAADLGRDVAAIPGRVTSRVSAGTNALLHDGAAVVRGAEDVLDLLFGAGNWDAGAVSGRGDEESLEASLRGVLRAIEAGDELDRAARAAGLDGGELRAALGRLELLGFVRRNGLGAYERAAGR
jgi:DNA processing protein